MMMERSIVQWHEMVIRSSAPNRKTESSVGLYLYFASGQEKKVVYLASVTCVCAKSPVQLTFKYWANIKADDLSAILAREHQTLHRVSPAASK